MINLPDRAAARVDSTKCFVPHQLNDMSNNMFWEFYPLKCVKSHDEKDVIYEYVWTWSISQTINIRFNRWLDPYK